MPAHSKPIDTTEAKRLYVEEGLSLQKIARQFGVSRDTVTRRLLAIGVKPSQRVSLDLDEVKRLYVEEQMTAQAIADQLGTSRGTISRRLRSMGVDLEKTGQRNPRWNGGRWKGVNGYIILNTSEGEKYEHRVVMEEITGRPLRPEEEVHHRNHVRDDNRPENLQLMANHAEHMAAHRRSKDSAR